MFVVLCIHCIEASKYIIQKNFTSSFLQTRSDWCIIPFLCNKKIHFTNLFYVPVSSEWCGIFGEIDGTYSGKILLERNHKFTRKLLIKTVWHLFCSKKKLFVYSSELICLCIFNANLSAIFLSLHCVIFVILCHLEYFIHV